MKEEMVQWVWEEQLFDAANLTTAEGEPISIHYKGDWNTASGPDFRNAFLKLSSSTWVGHVEIHLKASDWYQHKHHLDSAYSNVILHVVLWDDIETVDSLGRKIPCLVIPEKAIQNVQRFYKNWLSNKGELPCDGYISFTSTDVLDSWLLDLSKQRVAHKLSEAHELLIRLKGDILLTELVATARVLGLPLNEYPMEQLALRIPWMSVIRKEWNWKDFREWILSLSGLTEWNNDYLDSLWKVDRLDSSLWRWGGMRPNAFPKVRLIQWSWMVYQRFISKQWNSITSIYSSSLNWKELEGCVKPGKFTLDNWAVNLSAYEQIIVQKEKSNSQLILEFWESLSPEVNRIVKHFIKQGLQIDSARETQALAHLDKVFCRPKKCVNCAIGRFHFKRAEYDRQIKGGV